MIITCGLLVFWDLLTWYVANRLTPEEAPGLPACDFEKVKRLHKRMHETRAVFWTVFLVTQLLNRTEWWLLQRTGIVILFALLIAQLAFMYKAGKIQKSHGLKFFYFDSVVGGKYPMFR